MIRVNLLPHRQIKRAARQREFGLMAMFSLMAAAALVFLGYSYINAQVEAQAERNARLDTAIAALDKEIADIKDLKDQINIMLERKQVVENLQTNRSQSVVILDEVSRQLPEGMYLRSIKQQGNAITLEGVADTNSRVATLVRNFSTSNWMESPSLVEIRSEAGAKLKQNAFSLGVNIKPPKTADAEVANANSPALAGSAP
ncbi:MAG TPA: PilN domain-containing protein [Methylotenera sp.]|nr:PilN domain-containing protein [Methylotenera sp.]HPH05446.1 PilN domain-containing protein [Methylotenera sp.]HPN02145.1 PilN domain-containing protein [Methylotenera sp.]